MSDKTQYLRICLMTALMLSFVGCGSQDDRLHDLARESLKRQAEQNSQMARQTQTVADATERLVEADAQVREQQMQVQRELQSERANLDRQHEDLDQERQQIAKKRRWDSVLGPTILSAAGIIAAILPLIVCLLLLYRFSGNTPDEELGDLLIQELVAEKPLLLPPANVNSSTKRITGHDAFQEQKRLATPGTPASPATDSRAKLLIVVEGHHDAAFLKQISSMLQSAGKDVPDLQKLEANNQVVFVPIGGGDIGQWTDRFAGLGLREFHLYDREIGSLTEERQASVAMVDQRDSCCGFLTQKRAIENYLHPRAIADGLEVEVTFSDTDDVAERVAQVTLQARGDTDWSSLSPKARKKMKERAKVRLHQQAVPRMTASLLADRDPEGEVVGWLTTIGRMLQS